MSDVTALFDRDQDALRCPYPIFDALRAGDTDGTQVRALELLGKTLGLFIDKVETEDKTPRNADAVRAELEARLNRLIG